MTIFLSKKEKIMLEVYKHNQRNEPIYLTKLVKIFKKEIDFSTVLNCINDYDFFDKKSWNKNHNQFNLCVSEKYLKYMKEIDI